MLPEPVYPDDPIGSTYYFNYKQYDHYRQELKEGEKRRVVLFLGFWKSSPRILNKYIEFYGQLTDKEQNPVFDHCVTYRIPHEGSKIKTKDYFSLSARTTINWLLEHKFHERSDILISVMSNGGSYPLRRLRNEIEQMVVNEGNIQALALAKSIIGYTFDSSPIQYRNFWDFTAYFALYNPKNIWWRTLLLSFYLPFMYIKRVWNKKEHDDFWSDMINPPSSFCNPIVPHLLLYSENDPISPPSVIKEFGNEIRKKGARVDELYLSDSPHCGHLRAHPKQYFKSFQDFVWSLID